jgi:hypothetical protein
VPVGGTTGQVLSKIDGTDYNTQWVTGGGGGGVTSVTGTAPIASSGGATPDISIADGTTSVKGAVQLTDSVTSTSTTTAATPNSVKTAYDIATAGWEAFIFGTAGIVATHPRFNVTVGASGTSGLINHTRLVPHKDFTVSNIAFVSGSAAAATVTTIRFGIYTRSGTTFTLVARTASDATIFNATNTKFTRALDTTGGYPATYTMTAGTEYYISLIQVATTPSNLIFATARISTGANAATGVQLYTDSGETDLVSSSTGSASATGGGLYAEVS